ncbi:hypothetical protein QAD02_001265 [Eretmocerus hayati]|uniref:Uncharacterized protein n=1 Tax=Eretmocerus hayati TaxID=131215 RepID=A0ACC2NGH4_9HYME|nr:hypothetical protein QAD02_001265 [Eretmocerus hayati]
MDGLRRKMVEDLRRLDKDKVAIQHMKLLNTHPCLKVLQTKENTTSYKSVYTIPVRNLYDDDMEFAIRSSTFALIGLAKYTNLFNSKYNFSDMKRLMKNDTAIFVGALLLKFNIAITSICDKIDLVDPTREDYTTVSELTVRDPKMDIMQTNCFLRASTMLHLNGCMPNVDVCLSHDVKFIIYALQPIKKGTKLIRLHPVSIYNYSPKSKRQARHQMYYNCPCDCQACTENWFESSLGGPFFASSGNVFSEELTNEMMSIREDFETNFRKPNYPDIKVVSRAKDLLAKVWIQLDMPSPMTIYAVLLLVTIIHGFHRPSETFRVAGPNIKLNC